MLGFGWVLLGCWLRLVGDSCESRHSHCCFLLSLWDRMKVTGRCVSLESICTKNDLIIFIFLFNLNDIVACGAENRNNSHWFRWFALKFYLDWLRVSDNRIISERLWLAKNRCTLTMLINPNKNRFNVSWLRGLKFHFEILLG